MIRFIFILFAALLLLGIPNARAADPDWQSISQFFSPPKEFAADFGKYRSPLVFNDGSNVKTAEQWKRRRAEILADWTKAMGEWPALLAKPKLERIASVQRDQLTQYKIRVETGPKQSADGYLLVPNTPAKHPAVFVPYYEPETSIGKSEQKRRDYAYQLALRGFVTLAIGSPGGDARRPEVGEARCQPLSYLAYVSANCHTALAQQPEVDADRIGIMGHSYGGKWALFSAALYDKWAACCVSDPGVAFDEKKPNVNYWDPWYLGDTPEAKRPIGLPDKDHPRTGAYKTLVENSHDLHELICLICPRPLLVSGGSEDGLERWPVLNHAAAVNRILGVEKRVGLTTRKGHDPTEESNGVVWTFFLHFL